mgnify:CR=1 FL=1
MSQDKNIQHNIKDSIKDNLKDNSFPASSQLNLMSYTKLNKLIMALYMVTDIINEEDPIRNKLRNLGLESMSDIEKKYKKISEILSLLDICLAINLISEMNGNILKKEFFLLRESISEYKSNPNWIDKLINSPSDFSSDSSMEEIPDRESRQENKKIFNIESPSLTPHINNYSIRQSIRQPTRESIRQNDFIGQSKIKRMQELSIRQGRQNNEDCLIENSVDNLENSSKQNNQNNFGMTNKMTFKPINIKQERQNELIKIIKSNKGSATISDIRVRAQDIKLLMSYSEKTLQRELMSMIKDGVLYKTGEKRWSKYSLVMTPAFKVRP